MCAHSLHATNPEGSTLDTLGAGSGTLLVGAEDRLCCCWRCRQLVITDAGSNPELAAWASHFWSSYLPIVDPGLGLPVCLTKDFHTGRLRLTAGFEPLFGVGFQRVSCPLRDGTAF